MHCPSVARVLAFSSAAMFVFACAGNKDNGRSDTAAAVNTTDSASGSMATNSQGMSSMQKDSTGGMTGMAGMSNMTGNPDQDFLRMMSDHHKAMIKMAHEVKGRKGSSVTDIANRIDTQQDKELEQMTSMLEKDFKDSYEPKVMPENQKMADQLTSKTGPDFDRTFLQNTITHHQQAIKMVDDYLQKAKNASIKQMAVKIKADQTREIGEFQRRVGKMKG